MSNENIFICYTDGSARPNPGYGGCGVFGYLLKPSKRPRNVNYPIKNNFKLTYKGILTNAEEKKLKSPNNYECLGIYEHIGCIDSDHATNNQAEVEALRIALLATLSLEDVGEALIISDSSYAIKSYKSYLDRWVDNGFKSSTGDDIKNQDQWRELHVLKEELKERKIKVELKWVKGHQGDEGNTLADMYALIGSNYSKNQYTDYGEIKSISSLSEFTDMRDFRKELDDNHFSMGYKFAFFYTGDRNNDVYMLANVARRGKSSAMTQELLGYRDQRTTYALMYKGIPAVVNNLRNSFSSLKREFDVIAMLDLEGVRRDKLVKRLIDKVGFESIVTRVKDGNWNSYCAFNQDGVIVREVDPSFTHMFEVRNTYSLLEETVMKLEVLKKKEMLIDMTDFFYDPETGKCNIAYQDKEEDITDLFIELGFDLTSKIVIEFGTDTPSYKILEDIEGRVSNIWAYPDTIYNRNLITLVFIVEYKDEDGEDAILAQTNVLGKYLTRAKQ